MTTHPQNTAQITAELSQLFETHAHVPPSGAVDVDAPFLHRLKTGAKNISNLRNSFRGIARLYRFLGAVQMHFGVCFALDDAEKEWTLQTLAAHIAHKKSNAPAQRTLAKKRVARAKMHIREGMVKAFLFLSLPLGIFVWHAFDGAAGRAAGLCIAAVPSVMVLWFSIKEWIFYRQLSAKIETAEGTKQ